MSVWLCIPSKRPAAEANIALRKWREMGYRIALWVDDPAEVMTKEHDRAHVAPYPGYALACNQLIRMAAQREPDANWFVCAGDDTHPDPTKTAEEIARECEAHFGGTFGVMQPTGDRWGESAPNIRPYRSAYIDRVCGSPWIGWEFACRMYQGNGPYWPEYTHMGVDEELQLIAQKYGVLWQRRDLTHFHDHWGRKRGQASDMPEFLREANSQLHWNRYKHLLALRQSKGFPGSEPL